MSRISEKKLKNNLINFIHQASDKMIKLNTESEKRIKRDTMRKYPKRNLFIKKRKIESKNTVTKISLN